MTSAQIVCLVLSSFGMHKGDHWNPKILGITMATLLSVGSVVIRGGEQFHLHAMIDCCEYAVAT